MAGDVDFVKGLLKFQLEFVDVDPMDLAVQTQFEIEYSCRNQKPKEITHKLRNQVQLIDYKSIQIPAGSNSTVCRADSPCSHIA